MIHVFVSDQIHVAIFVDGIYEEYCYDTWKEALTAHPISFGGRKFADHIYVHAQ